MDPNPAVKLDVVSNPGDPLVWDHSHSHYYNVGGYYHSCSQNHLNPNYEFTQIHPDGTEEVEKVYYEDGTKRIGTPETVRAWLTNFDDEAEGKEASQPGQRHFGSGCALHREYRGRSGPTQASETMCFWGVRKALLHRICKLQIMRSCPEASRK